MANNDYVTAAEAAVIAGISPSEIAAGGNNFFVTKKNLIDAKKFKTTPLASYENNEFVLYKDVQKGTVKVQISGLSKNGVLQVQINDGRPSITEVSANVEIGSTVIVNMQALLSKADNCNYKYIGWYDDHKNLLSEGVTDVFGVNSYSFVADKDIILHPNFVWMQATPARLHFSNEGGAFNVAIIGNVPERNYSIDIEE